MKTVEPLPMDIKLMNGLASALFGLVLLMLASAALFWAVRLPLFAVHGVTVLGDVSHYNSLTLRANVMPRLQGTFFTLNLEAARVAFETLPWVRQAVVRRDFPNRLKVILQEHRAVAFWGADGDTRLVNSFGEVFEANVGEIEQDRLPRLTGPEGQSAQVMAMYQTLQPLFARMDLVIDQLELTPRGGWRAQLDAGTSVELGTGSAADLVARVDRFLKTATQVTARYQRTPEQLASVDLRHADGYAIRLDGVSTRDGNGNKTLTQDNR
jgi:cell division protein FtsQ